MNRERLYDKIRALLSKTTENGCTEAEALAALTKARAMMDAYEVTQDDLRLTKEEAAVLKRTETTDDKHGIARSLVKAVSIFCDCEGWRSGDKFVFAGTPADAQLADWLHKHLIAFVQAELAAHLLKDDSPRGMRRRIINGFVLGCCARITVRVQELERQRRAAARVNSNALVVIKADAIRKLKADRGITLTKTTSRRRYDRDALLSGASAGDRATLNKPVDTARGTLLLR